MELCDLFEKVNKNYVNFKGSPRKKELKKEMEREIKHFSKMSSDDKRAYPEDWTADRRHVDHASKVVYFFRELL